MGIIEFIDDGDHYPAFLLISFLTEANFKAESWMFEWKYNNEPLAHIIYTLHINIEHAQQPS